MVSVISLIIIIFLSIIVTRIATIALMHTGLSKQSSRFQARSAFTGVGYTTGEAENIVQHPVRRKIVMLLMLLGNAGVISAIASLLLAFIGENEDDIAMIYKLLILLGGIVSLWIFASSDLIDNWMSRVVGRMLKKFTDLNVSDYDGLLRLSGDYEISELLVEQEDWMADKRLKDLSLREEGINVLGVNRKKGKFIGTPTGETKVRAGDKLVLYGRKSGLKNLDTRKKGIHGNIEHKKTINEHRAIEQRENEEDELESQPQVLVKKEEKV